MRQDDAEDPATAARRACGDVVNTRQKIHALLARGAAGGLFFATDDTRASYEELKTRGVEFTQEPTEQPYGLDAGFRDPSGNHFRMIQSTD